MRTEYVGPKFVINAIFLVYSHPFYQKIFEIINLKMKTLIESLCFFFKGSNIIFTVSAGFTFEANF